MSPKSLCDPLFPLKIKLSVFFLKGIVANDKMPTSPRDTSALLSPIEILLSSSSQDIVWSANLRQLHLFNGEINLQAQLSFMEYHRSPLKGCCKFCNSFLPGTILSAKWETHETRDTQTTYMGRLYSTDCISTLTQGLIHHFWGHVQRENDPRSESSQKKYH